MLIILVIVFSLAVYLITTNPIKDIKGSRIGSLDIEKVKTASLISEQYNEVLPEVDDSEKLIPGNFIINDLKDNSKYYVCVIDRKKEAFSMDYQYYWVKGHLQQITVQ